MNNNSDFERLIPFMVPHFTSNTSSTIQNVISIALAFSAISKTNKWTNLIFSLKIGRENNTLSKEKIYQKVLECLYLPYFLERFETLNDLKKKFSKIQAFTSTLADMENLKEVFDFIRNKIWIYRSKTDSEIFNMTYIDLHDRNLSSLPENIGYLTNLTQLNLNKNNLTSLPESLGNLTNLRQLYLNDNKLTSLPQSLSNLDNLLEFSLGYNQLTSISPIENITSLREIHLNNNELTSVENIGNLVNLKSIYLDNNQLTSLPKNIGDLTVLRYISLSDNQIVSLPESFSNLRNLEKVFLTNNPLDSKSLVILKGLAKTNLNIRIVADNINLEIIDGKRKIRKPWGKAPTTNA